MSPKEFDKLVERAIAKIPPRFLRRMHNVAFIVEPQGSSPNLLGLYVGRPLTERSVGEGFVLPDRILIFQRPHERMARSIGHLEKLIHETVWHEVAHYFGMDEGQVRRAERRRARRGL